MQTKATSEALNLLKEALKGLESSKGSVFTGIQKLVRAANILEEKDVAIWCEIQFGNPKYTAPLQNLISAFLQHMKRKTKVTSTAIQRTYKELDELDLKQELHYSDEELTIKANKAGGGYNSINFVEERYAYLVKNRRGNDNTYYQGNLLTHISYVRRTAHARASSLYNRVAFSDVPATAFDVLKIAVDDRLLNLAPQLAEKLMIAFKSISTEIPEEWSQALTTCRRFIEDLADVLFPTTNKKIDRRDLGQAQYINRLWAFMDSAIESESNKELAKAHVDFLGSLLEKVHKVTHKGVHADLERLEAVKAVFHTYLMVADILDYLKVRPIKSTKLNIHRASLDELESILRISRQTAKGIIKLRVDQQILTPELLSHIKGIGPKTISKAKELLSFEVL